MKKITSFTHHITAEGDRISFTYSEIDDSGKLINQNKRENFIVMNAELQVHINSINNYISQNILNE